jgi:hypothetical protein
LLAEGYASVTPVRAIGEDVDFVIEGEGTDVE